jgi:hypothetical protein
MSERTAEPLVCAYCKLEADHTEECKDMQGAMGIESKQMTLREVEYWDERWRIATKELLRAKK